MTLQEQKVAKMLRFGSEPGAIVDDRPAARFDWRTTVGAFIFGGAIGALFAALWFRAEIRDMAETMNRISHYNHGGDDGVQGDQERHR